LKTVLPSEVKLLLPELIEWIADINWPIASAAVAFLAHHVPPSDLVPRINEVLAKNDDVELSNNCLCFLVASMKKEDAVFLRPDLERMVNSPTKEEAEYELQDQAMEILNDWDDNSAPKEP
jgi:hypothetical protein